ncbi:hypothetical protein [Burkholderia ubonensis]|uniref:hypothetical protein n=1 Tax=Burkholderia ubonensis TaxID=101571 RepID=UPI002ABDE80A|nr:hypothetical protein [Burkholderia ubonensis]
MDQVRSLSLKHHLALAALDTGRGDIATIVTLSNVLQLSVYLDVSGDLELFRHSEVALDECVARAGQGEPWMLTDEERTALKTLVVVHDRQLATVPTHRYLDALERAQRANTSDFRVPTRSQG